MTSQSDRVFHEHLRLLFLRSATLALCLAVAFFLLFFTCNQRAMPDLAIMLLEAGRLGFWGSSALMLGAAGLWWWEDKYFSLLYVGVVVLLYVSPFGQNWLWPAWL